MLREASIGRAWRSVMQTDDKMLPTSEALAYLAKVWGFKRSPITLSKWASAGTGPAVRKFGRYNYYAPTDLDGFMKSRLSARQQPPESPAEDVTPSNKTRRKAADQQSQG